MKAQQIFNSLPKEEIKAEIFREIGANGTTSR